MGKLTAGKWQGPDLGAVGKRLQASEGASRLVAIKRSKLSPPAGRVT